MANKIACCIAYNGVFFTFEFDSKLPIPIGKRFVEMYLSVGIDKIKHILDTILDGTSNSSEFPKFMQDASINFSHEYSNNKYMYLMNFNNMKFLFYENHNEIGGTHLASLNRFTVENMDSSYRLD